MPLIPCPDCRKQLSDSCDACPKCGHQLTPAEIAKAKQQQKQLGIVWAVIGLIVVLMVVLGLVSRPAHSDKIGAYVMSQGYVTKCLRAPSTASFPWYDDSFVAKLGDGRFRVVSYVDSQNGFGAKIRTQYTCVLSTDDGRSWSLEDINID